jgi:hypothetical protein
MCKPQANVSLYEPVFDEDDVRELCKLGLSAISGERVKVCSTGFL